MIRSILNYLLIWLIKIIRFSNKLYIKLNSFLQKYFLVNFHFYSSSNLTNVDISLWNFLTIYKNEFLFLAKRSNYINKLYTKNKTFILLFFTILLIFTILLFFIPFLSSIILLFFHFVLFFTIILSFTILTFTIIFFSIIFYFLFYLPFLLLYYFLLFYCLLPLYYFLLFHRFLLVYLIMLSFFLI